MDVEAAVTWCGQDAADLDSMFKLDSKEYVKMLNSFSTTKREVQIARMFEEFKACRCSASDLAEEHCSSGDVPEQGLRGIVDSAYDILKAERVSLFLVDHESQQLRLRVTKDVEAGFAMPINCGIAGSVASSGRLQNIADAYQHPDFNREVDGLTCFRTRSVLAVPVTVSGRVLAVLMAINKIASEGVAGEIANFSADDEKLGVAVAGHVGAVLRSFQLSERCRRKEKATELALTMLKVFSSCPRLHCATEKIVECSYGLVQADRVSIYLHDDSTSELECIVSKDVRGFRIPENSGIAGHVFQCRETVTIADAYADARFNPEVDRHSGYVTKSILATPIRNSRGHTIGVLQAVNKLSGEDGGGAFDEQDAAVFEAISAQAGTALYNAKMYAKVERANTMNALFEDVAKSTLSSEYSVLEVCEKVNLAAAAVAGGGRSQLLVVDEARGCFECFADSRDGAGRDPDEDMTLHRGLRGCVYEQRETLSDSGAKAAGNRDPEVDGRHQLSYTLCAPVVDGQGRLIAVLEVSEKPSRVQKEDVRAIEKLCSIAAIVLGEKGAQDLDGGIEASEARALLPSCGAATPRPRVLEVAADLSGAFVQPASAVDRMIDAIVAAPSPSALNSWAFDVIDFHGHKGALRTIALKILRVLGIDEWAAGDRTLGNFIECVCNHYFDVPFHSFTHAVCVQHAAYYLLKCTSAGEALTDFQMATMCVAALCHDVGHPGHTNLFEINTASQRALTYNDRSVLENFHCALAFRIINTPECNILQGLSKKQRKDFRTLVVDGILKTDMAKHFILIDAFNAAETPEQLDLEMRTGMLLHAADLSNPVRQWESYRRWAQLVHAEFDLQVEAEIELGIEPLPFMRADSSEVRAKQEVGFITFVILPMWQCVARKFPDLEFALEKLQYNKEQWQALAGDEGDKEEAEEDA